MDQLEGRDEHSLHYWYLTVETEGLFQNVFTNWETDDLDVGNESKTQTRDNSQTFNLGSLKEQQVWGGREEKTALFWPC